MQAFIVSPFRTTIIRQHVTHRSPTLCMNADSRQAVSSSSRRSFLTAAAAFTIAALVPNQLLAPANARVDIDTERFGDKELKVSAINKVKQNVRNVLTKNPELLPYFFSMTLHDALTFNPETRDGGPNGSLRLELDREVNANLKEAHDAIAGIQSLQRENMSYADTCAFAGAVAIEVTGGPRIVIQLGREDANRPDPENKSGLYRPGASSSELRRAFDAAGLDGTTDVVLFHGAIGSLNDIGQSRAAKIAKDSIDDGLDLDDIDNVDDFDDVTYGKVQSKKRGAVLVETNVSQLTLGGQKFGNSYLKAILKAKDRNSLSQRDVAILDDPQMKAVVQKYADNNSKFTNDVADLFQKISLLGSSFQSLTLEA